MMVYATAQKKFLIKECDQTAVSCEFGHIN